MSSLGRNLGRALGGIGAGVAALSSKYIDEELTQQRAQALADIQFAGAKRTEAWQQSAEVQGPRLVNQRNELAMRNEESLKGRVAEATNPELRQARVDERVQYLEGTTPAEVAAANARIEGTSGAELDKERMRRKVLDPMDVSKAAATADATWAAREKYDQRLEGKSLKSAFDRLPEGKKLEVQQIAGELKDINKAMIEAQAGGAWDPAKNPGQRQLDISKAALQQRLRGLLGDGGGDDPLGLFGDRTPAGKSSPAAGQPETRGTAAKEPTPERKPNLMEKAVAWFSETGRDYDSPEGKQALRQRLAEAKAGGQALTRVEQLRAQQLGLM